MTKRKLIIFPFNGNGIEALDCIDSDVYELLGFVDDDQQKKSRDYEIFSRSFIAEHPEVYILAVPGSPSSFRERVTQIEALDIAPRRFISVIHSKASIGKNVTIGYNCLIMAGVVLTSNAHLGNHVCVLPNSVIHHDVKINDYTLIGSNVVIAGGTTVGCNCYIGSGTNVINGIKIGDRAMIGLGSNILKYVAANTAVAGNPAREIHQSNPRYQNLVTDKNASITNILK